MTDTNPARAIPAIGRCLASRAGAALEARFGRPLVSMALRGAAGDTRRRVGSGDSPAPTVEMLLSDAEAFLRAIAPNRRRALNATGILLHTGLGRSPLSRPSLEALATFGSYSVLEVDRRTGARTRRDTTAETLITELTGFAAAAVVNNNAAATFLLLHVLGAGREVIVSRGQLGIGGAFRMPDVMAMSGAVLREVGTTNRTHLSDYELAINDRTALLLHVHPSNYRIHGFASTPPVKELAALGARYGLPVIDDLGSGALVSLAALGLPDEGIVADSARDGAAAACFSGDKLAGGPQAGIICGSRGIVAAVRKSPFYRMFRVDKLTLAALETTLACFIAGDLAGALPLYELLSRSSTESLRLAETLAGACRDLAGWSVEVAEDSAYFGGGSLPDQAIASHAVVLKSLHAASLDDIAKRLRTDHPAVFGRIGKDALILNVRTLFERDLALVADAVRRAVETDSR